MRARPASAIALLVAVATLAVAVGAASAGQLEVRGAERGFRLVWSSLHLAWRWNNNSFATTCPVTLEGSFHARTMRKVLITLIGYVTSASMPEAACRVGEVEWPVRARLLTETLPWHIRYNGFTGTLPAITAMKVQLQNVSIFVHENTVVEWSCLYRTTAASPMQYLLNRERGGAITEVIQEPARATAPWVTGFLCGETLTYEGNPSLTQSGIGNRVTLTLI
jgi:hypothetical protein